MRIDAHQHFWQLSLPFDYRWLEQPALREIHRDYSPADLKPHLDAVKLERSVVVQTQHSLEENHWALSLAEHNDFLAGVVGWVDLASTDCERQLLEFKNHPKFVGVRHVTQDEPDDDFIVREEVLRGLSVLEKHAVPFDLLFFVKHLRHVPTLARRLPNLPMVIDHLAKPRIKNHVLDEWLPQFQAAARHPNVFCKLSGLATEAAWKNWKPADFAPFVKAAIDAFGPSRCMFGSDWPVCEVSATYVEVYHLLDGLLGSLSPSERESVFGGTALSFYNLSTKGGRA